MQDYLISYFYTDGKNNGFGHYTFNGKKTSKGNFPSSMIVDAIAAIKEANNNFKEIAIINVIPLC